MRILFVIPSAGYYTRGLSNPMGVVSICTYLKQHGHTVQIVDRCIEMTNFRRELDDFRPDIVGVSLMSTRALRDAIRISSIAKAAGKTVVWGGQFPSIQTDLALQDEDVDYISIGEGELTWLDIAEHLERGEPLDDVAGLAYRKGGETFFTPCRPFADLRELPIADYTLINAPKYLKTFLGCKRMMYFYSSKGCPYRCAFCTNVMYHKRKHRKRPNEYVIEEIRYLKEHHGLDGAYMTEELWCLSRDDLNDFCARIRPLGIHWGVLLRIGMFEEEDYRRMYDAGCRWILFGIESGSKEMLHRIHKEIRYDKIVPTFRLMKEIGITSVASFIIGYPGETEEQLRDTVRMLNAIDSNLVTVYHFTPLPGTELYDEVVQSGAYDPPKTLREASKIVATETLGKNLSQVPDVDLRVIRSWYNWKIFSSKNAIHSGKRFEFAKETILSGLQSIAVNGPLYFLVNGFHALYEFLYTVWYAHAHPAVIRKYGLDQKPAADPETEPETDH